MACEERIRRGHWPRPVSFLVKTFTANELAAGAPGWRVGFGGLKAFDALQRHGHLGKVILKVTMSIAAGSGTIRGFDLPMIANVLSLRDAAGHEYFSGLDGRDWIDDYLFRTGRLPGNQNANITLQAGTAQTVTIRIVLDLRTRPVGDAQYWEEHPLDGMIPLALLDDRSNAAAVLQGQFAATLTETVVGNTNAVTVTACECWAEVYYDEDVVSDAPWVIDVQTSTVKPFVVEVKGARDGHAVQYSMLRHRTEQTGGVELSQANSYSAIKVDHGSDNWYAGMTAIQAHELLRTLQPSHHEDDLSFVAPTPTINNAVLLGAGVVEVIPLMFSPYGIPRAAMGAGPITLDYTDTLHTGGPRIQSRIISPATVQYQTDVARLVGIPMDKLVQRIKGGGPGNAEKIAALLPRAYEKAK